MSRNRQIFEEVGSNAAPRPQPPSAGGSGPARLAIARWLTLLLVLVVLMIAVGGLTRLTDSGLSITEWRPVTGAIPPLNVADWLAEFELYRSSPQYLHLNQGMSLDEFKVIYWWEWGHRQLGRVIGLVWAAGFLWFWARGQIPSGWTGRLLLLGALGGLQGAIGWWMVASGLEGEMVAVASTRLAVHLGLAFVIIGLIGWYGYLLRRDSVTLLQARRQRLTGLFGASGVLVGLLFVQIVLGALVAGIDAGRTYTDWPLMAGVFFPPESMDLAPLHRNFTQNPALVQFNHRMVGYGVALFALWLWWRARASALAGVRRRYGVLALVVLAQVALGVFTVLSIAQVHVALSHQLLAVVLFLTALRARFEAGYPASQSIRR